MTNVMDDNGSLRHRVVGQAKPLSKSINVSKAVKSDQQWLNTVSTRDCEVIMTFPPKTRDTFLIWMLTLIRQRTPELIVRIRQHRDTGVYAFYLTASNENMFKGAEDLAIKKQLTEELGGGLKEFLAADVDCFKGSNDPDTFFTTEERQRIVRHFLYNLRAKNEDHVGKLNFLEGQAIVPILLSHGIIHQVFAVHNEEELKYLVKNWVQAVFRSQPIDKVCSYFGVKLAMYFAYLGHYTRALVIPTVFGAAIYYLTETNQDLGDIGIVVFAIINVMWATLYLEHWKRRSAEFAHQWGTLDMPSELLAEPRPLYHGPLQRSKVTGNMEPHYPSWKRNVFRYCVSIPLIVLSLGVVFATMLSIFMLQDWLNDEIKEERFPSYVGIAPKVLLAVSIGVFDDVYKKIAYWLNNKENHRLDETYETNLIIKLVMFQFVNSFLSLFYIAFYLQDMDRLREQLAALLITRQVIGNVKEALIPYVLTKVKQFHTGYKMAKVAKAAGAESKTELEDQTDKIIARVARRNSEKDAKDIKDEVPEVAISGGALTQGEVEASWKEYEDTLEDQLEMLIQFGYVTLFSCAFPLAAACALFNNVIEIRSDAFKMCTSQQRPFGQLTDGIGIWLGALELMSVIAVFVNCALIGFSGLALRLFPGYSTADRIVFIIILEHVILAGKLLLAFAIPDLPEWVTEEKARLEFQQREALKKLQSANSRISQSPEPVAGKSLTASIVETTVRFNQQQQNPSARSSGPAATSTPVRSDVRR